MSSTESRSDSDRTYVINACGQRRERVVGSRSREIAHEFDRYIGAFTRAWYAFIKNGSNGGMGPKNPEFVSQWRER